MHLISLTNKNKRIMYPLKFENIFKTVVWGGEKIAPFKGVETDQHNIGESWELADMGIEDSVVADGWLAGNTISELMETYLERIVGEDVYNFYGRQFPLLIKFLDINDKLSVQVHPDDEVAAEAMGINLAKHKRMSFITSSFFAGIGGGMMAMYMGAIAAAPFKSTLTYEILLIVVIGGIGSVSGSILASFLYIFSSEWLLRGLDSGTFLGINAPGVFKNGFRMAVFSVIIMLVVLFFRKGIFGDKELPDLIGRRKKVRVKKTKKQEVADHE